MPADGRLIPDEAAVSRIEAMIGNKDGGSGSIDCLRGDDAAQNFIDRVQEVRPTILHFRGAL